MKSKIKAYLYPFQPKVCSLQALVCTSVLFLSNLYIIQRSLLTLALFVHTGFQTYLYQDTMLLCATVPREVWTKVLLSLERELMADPSRVVPQVLIFW